MAKETTTDTIAVLEKGWTWDEKRGCAIGPHNTHHGEMLPGADVTNAGTDERLQNLADKRGMDGAKRSLEGRWKEK